MYAFSYKMLVYCDTSPFNNLLNLVRLHEDLSIYKMITYNQINGKKKSKVELCLFVTSINLQQLEITR